jgi:hypothetical protein
MVVSPGCLSFVRTESLDFSGGKTMRVSLVFPLAVVLGVSIPAMAQEHGGQRGGQEHGGAHAAPRSAPQPPARREGRAKPEIDRRGGGRVSSVPHVRDNHWYGHDRPGDKRFHLDHPFEHGHFEHFGPSYRYGIERFDRGAHRFWFPGGFSFVIAPWDWDVASDWCWDCGGDDFVVYDDPDHPGWYLVYDSRTGQYVHAQYMGQ